MKKLSLVVVVVVVFFGVQAASAFAADAAYVGLGPVYEQGTDGEPVHQQRLAVNRGTDRVYLADVVGDRVRVFDPTATGAVEGAAFGFGDVVDPLGVAVDQETGAIYVSDADDVVKYSSDGVLDVGFASPGVTGPVAFDQAADQLVVGDVASNVVRRYSPIGIPGATFDGSDGGAAFTGLQDLAIAPAGVIYVVDADGDPAQSGGANTRVEQYAAAGQHQATVAAGYSAATVAVDATGDRVVVSANQHAVFSDGAPTLSVFDSADLSAPIQQLDQGGLQYDTIRGLAIDDGPRARLYVGTDVGRFQCECFGRPSLRIYESIAPPTVAIAPPTAITGTGAQVSGTVNPNSVDTTYRFEYSSDAGASWQPVADDAGVGAGDSPVAVQAALAGLPATAYRVRLVAINQGGTTQSNPVSLTTLEIPATVTTGTVAERGTTHATLRGSVNPHGLQTSYHFEYGTTIGYGSRFPTGGDSVAGNGHDAREIARAVSGLQPGATYHFRLVATNSLGSVEGEDRTFATDAAGGPVRGYEMVSPLDNGGVSVNDSFDGVRTRPDGNAVVYSLNKAAYPDGAGTPLQPKVLGLRADGGWSNQSLDVPTTHDETPTQQILKTVLATSDDLRKTLVVSLRSLGGQGTEGNGNLYVYDTRTGQYTLVASSTDPTFYNELSGTYGTGAFAGGASDLSTVAFITSAALTPGAAGPMKTYAWSAATGLHFVGIFLNPGGGSNALRRANQVSDDGSRVYVDGNPTAGGVVSLYENGQVIPISVSHRQGDPPDLAQGVFLAASDDGRYAIFQANAALTDDANPPVPGVAQLYRYDAETGELAFLASARDAVPIGLRPETGEGYFFSGYPQAGATGTGPYIYRFDGSGVSFVAAAGDYPSEYLASESGRYLVFASAARLTGYDNAGSKEVYLYDAQAGELTCPSCRTDGGRPTGWPQIGQMDSAGSEWQGYFAESVTDGGEVFFDTPDPLVAGDVNGVRDVYSYRGGRVSLISPGTQAQRATFVEATPSGSDVFFVTTARLVGQDDNAAADLYDARVGGGIAAQSPRGGAVACEGPECREPDPAPGGPAPLATQTIDPDPDPGPARGARARVSVVRASFSSRALRITVRVSGRGRIRVAGTGVFAASRTASRAGRYTLRVPLTERVRESRRARRRVRVAVTVSLKPPFGAAATTKLARTLGR